jgi:hypothetical protein
MGAQVITCVQAFGHTWGDDDSDREWGGAWGGCSSITHGRGECELTIPVGSGDKREGASSGDCEDTSEDITDKHVGGGREEGGRAGGKSRWCSEGDLGCTYGEGCAVNVDDPIQEGAGSEGGVFEAIVNLVGVAGGVVHCT